MKIDMNDNLTAVTVIVGSAIAFGVAVAGIILISNTIDDNIKYNRYNEALQEYKKCAKDFTDSFDVRTYCGDAPSSIMML